MTIPASAYTLRVSEYHVPFSNDTLQMWSSIETCQQCSAHQDKNIQGLSPCLICCHQFLSCNFWITLTHLNLAPDNSSLYEDLLFPLFFYILLDIFFMESSYHIPLLDASMRVFPSPHTPASPPWQSLHWASNLYRTKGLFCHCCQTMLNMRLEPWVPL